MTVIAKIGVLEHGGKVRTKDGVFAVHRGPDGSYAVSGPAGEPAGRVRYDDERETLTIERPGFALSIRFRPELEHTRFELAGHTYEVATMDFGNISIKEDARAVVQGHVTVSGVRLLTVAPELVPVERELAFGLALRSSAADEDYWDEDQPFFEALKQRAEGAVLGEESRHGRDKA